MNPQFASNKQRLEHVFSESAKGNGRPFLEALADDVRWTVMGETAWSGPYRGKETILSKLIGPLRRALESPIKTHAVRFIAEGDFVCVQARGDNTTRSGEPYRNTYCFVFEFKDGEVRAITEYADTALINSVLGPPA
jgi:ketosteroid isomerase-like protein